MHVGVMAGVAFGAKTRSQSAVALVLMEEKGLNTGDFHEGFNFAAVHELPLVVVIEKKPFEPTVAASVAPAGEDHHQRLKSYGAPTITVDGNDALQVLQVVETAVGRARSGRGPSIIEARNEGRTRFSMREDIVTVCPEPLGRFLGPSGGIAAPLARTQPKLALEDDALNDPVEQFEAFLIEHAQLSPEEQDDVHARVTRLIAADARRAEEATSPEADSGSAGVYVSSAGGADRKDL